MSASAHTRDHRFGPELTHAVLNWLEGHGRRVVNTHRALYLEVSKVAQYAALNKAGIKTPRTVAAVGRAYNVVIKERILARAVIVFLVAIGGSLDGVVLLAIVDVVLLGVLILEYLRIERPSPAIEPQDPAVTEPS